MADQKCIFNSEQSEAFFEAVTLRLLKAEAAATKDVWRSIRAKLLSPADELTLTAEELKQAKLVISHAAATSTTRKRAHVFGQIEQILDGRPYVRPMPTDGSEPRPNRPDPGHRTR